MILQAIHPGEHLAEELNELALSAAEPARQLDTPTTHVTEILNGKRAIQEAQLFDGLISSRPCENLQSAALDNPSTLSS